MLPFPFPAYVRRCPSQQVVNDEHCCGAQLYVLEDRVVIPEHQRYHTQYYHTEHEYIIDIAPKAGAIIFFYYLIKLFPGHRFIV